MGDLTFLAGSFRRLRALLEGMLSRFMQIADRALYLKDLFACFAIEPEVTSPSDPVPFPDPIREGFRFERVSFRYPGTDQWVLEDLSFTLRAGETVALVGENGAGKATLAKLLAQGGATPSFSPCRPEGITRRRGHAGSPPAVSRPCCTRTATPGGAGGRSPLPSRGASRRARAVASV